MSAPKLPTAPQDPTAALMHAIDEMNRVSAEQRAREAARVAKLTPQQRAQEEQARAERLLTLRTKEFAKGIGDFAAHIPKLEALSTGDFAWLLAGAAPNGLKQGVLINTDVSAKQRDYLRVLDSCVGLTLHRIPGLGAAPRFRPADLLRAAREKNLGDHVLLARVFGPIGRGPSVQAPTLRLVPAAPAPAAVMDIAVPAGHSDSKPIGPDNMPPKPVSASSPEQVKKRHKKQFEEVVRAYLPGSPAGPDGRLLLNVQIPELRRKLEQVETFWKDADDKTFRRYVREHRPPIELRSGRPLSKPTSPASA